MKIKGSIYAKHSSLRVHVFYYELNEIIEG